MSLDPPQAHSPSPAASSASASQQAIASSARIIVRGWAVGSGLEGAGDGASARFLCSLQGMKRGERYASEFRWGA